MLDQEGLMNYISEKFPKSMNTLFDWNLLENVIDYGIENKNYSEGQLEGFLSKMIPEITEEEIIRFIK